MRNILFSIILLLNISASAQKYFSRSYNPLNAYEQIYGLAFSDGKTLACGMSSLNKLNDSSYNRLYNLDVYLSDSNFSSLQSKIHLYDSLYFYFVASYSTTYFDKNSLIFTKLIDTSDNTDYRFHYNYILKYYPDSFTYQIIPINLPYPKKANVSFAVKPAPDYYIITGKKSFLVPSNNFVAKMDTLGNIRWLKEYTDKTYVTGMYLMPDKSMLLYGFYDKRPLYYMWSMKLDSAGTIQWEKNYPNDSLYSQSIFYSATHYNNALYIGGRNSYNGWDTRRIGQLDRCFITKLDFSGKTQWEKNYLFATDTSLLLESHFNQILIKNNYIYALGTKDSVFASGGYQKVALLTKIDTMGTVQWYQIYNKTFGADNELYSIYDRGDGFMMCGYANDTSHNNYAQRDAWLLSVDTNGCIIPGCTPLKSPFSGIHNISENDKNFEVYPNPAKDILHIKWSYAIKENTTLYLYNNQAQELYKAILHKENTIKLNELNLKAGLYWVLIYDGTGSYYKKVIIE